MQTIKLRFVTNESFISKLIRFFTWSKFSHIDYVFDNGSCYSAMPNGVSFNDNDCYELIEYYELEVVNKIELEKFLYSQSGKPYDWKAIFGFIFRKNWSSDDKWFCSELIAAAVEVGGIKLFKNTTMDRITPRDLYTNPLLKKVN